MLLVGSALKNYTIAASDGGIGVVSDFLFDDRTWKMRWLVVDTGNWLPGRKVLLHPSAIGRADFGQEVLPVRLTKAQVEGSPDIAQDEPVSLQMQDNLYGYYGWDPLWGGGNLFGSYGGMMGMPLAGTPYPGEVGVLNGPRDDLLLDDRLRDDGDPHLRSMVAVTGYHVQATDGAIGHVENFLIDDETWVTRYLVVDTRNWWFGQHVLISPHAVREVVGRGTRSAPTCHGTRSRPARPGTPLPSSTGIMSGGCTATTAGPATARSARGARRAGPSAAARA